MHCLFSLFHEEGVPLSRVTFTHSVVRSTDCKSVVQRFTVDGYENTILFAEILQITTSYYYLWLIHAANDARFSTSGGARSGQPHSLTIL